MWFLSLMHRHPIATFVAVTVGYIILLGLMLTGALLIIKAIFF